MFRMFRPPSFMGHCRVLGTIQGFDSCPQMNLLIVFSSTFSMGFGMPCAFVRNWVCPPTITWIISHFLFMVGWVFSQVFSLALMVSIMGSHGVASLTLFPI